MDISDNIIKDMAKAIIEVADKHNMTPAETGTVLSIIAKHIGHDLRTNAEDILRRYF